MEKIEFAFRKEESGILGSIMRPVARVVLINGTKKVPEILYVDSGADITMIPKSVGEILGLKIKDDKIDSVKGIGERTVAMVVKKIKIQLGQKLILTRIAWALTEDVPLLLGRTDIFELFDITFSKNIKTIFSR
jgi:hypothetical protein